MELSFIIVNWNTAAYLVQCIGSIVDSKLSCSYEIIVIDNASSDGSPEMVERLFPRVTLIKNSGNTGFARASNRGLRRSSGRYICLVNSDVVVLENAVETLRTLLEKEPAVGIAGPQIIGADGKVQRSCMGFPTLFNVFARALALDSIFPASRVFGGALLTFWNHASRRSVDIINGCFWMVRRPALDAVGLLDEGFFMYGEDVDWCRRFRRANWEIVFCPEAKVIHYGGASSANAPYTFAIEQNKADLYYWRKHHSAISYMLFYIILVLHHFIRIIGYGSYALCGAAQRDRSVFKFRRSLSCLFFLIRLPGKPLREVPHEG